MNQNLYLKRYCPICQSKSTIQKEVSSENKAEDMDYESLVPYWNGFFKEKIFFSYGRCKKCNLLFAPIFYNGQQLQSLYSQMSPNMELVPMRALDRTQEGYFFELQKYSSLDGGYIEVGPDIGIFTKNCSRAGGFSHYWLCEPNEAVLDQLIEAVDGAPHTIIKDMFGFDQIPDGSASVAVMIQVLDHLLDPVATLKVLNRKLKPGAKLLLVTHNEASLLRKIVGWRWPAFCLQHPQIYNPQSITKLLEESGFAVDSIGRTKNYFECSFLIKHLMWAFGVKVKSVPKWLDFTLGLKLGNILTVATPK